MGALSGIALAVVLCATALFIILTFASVTGSLGGAILVALLFLAGFVAPGWMFG